MHISVLTRFFRLGSSSFFANGELLPVGVCGRGETRQKGGEAKTTGLPIRDDVSNVKLAVSSVSSLTKLIIEGENAVLRCPYGESGALRDPTPVPCNGLNELRDMLRGLNSGPFMSLAPTP
jgi:hypothetical protein